MQIPFSNRYVELGESFYARTRPAKVADPALIKFNEALADALGLPTENLEATELAGIFSGNQVPQGAAPLAMAYAGHQFGHFSQQLGDGRAILLGEVQSPGGDYFDIHLKGSGPTFYSRGGDGRAALGPVLREYLVSEAMFRLGVPTTRALAAVMTGERVIREQFLPGGVITRVAKSFVRVGTFQYFAARGDVDAIRKLADYVIDRSYPRARDEANPYIALLEAVVDRQASLIAQWMQLGFIHGVMNTDNMSIAGETIDYGPCAFMDAYVHDQVFSSIDRSGRYAYNNQPSIGLWNLTRLAESLLPLLAGETGAAVKIAQAILETYIKSYEKYWLAGMRRKLGLTAGIATDDEDRELVEALLNAMADSGADFTLTFYYLSRSNLEHAVQEGSLGQLFRHSTQFDAWIDRWCQRLASESREDAERQADMRTVNPVYIPRNHQVEAAIRAAEDQGDFSVFHALHEVLQYPYVEQQGRERYRLPPEPEQVVRQTFCGT